MVIYFNERLSSKHCKCIFPVLHSMSQQQSTSDSYTEFVRVAVQVLSVSRSGSLIFARRALTMRPVCENTCSIVADVARVQNIFDRSGRSKVIQQKRAFPHLEAGIP